MDVPGVDQSERPILQLQSNIRLDMLRSEMCLSSFKGGQRYSCFVCEFVL